MLSTARSRRTSVRGAAEILFFTAPIFVWLGRRFNADLWSDEITTLESWCTWFFWRAATDYQDVGNHILFSLVTTVFLTPLRLLDLIDASTLYHHPWIPRTMTLAFADATVVLTARAARRHIDVDLAPSPSPPWLPRFRFSISVFSFGATPSPCPCWHC